MTPAEFVRRMGFPPETVGLFSKCWSGAPEMETLPACFRPGFFVRYAEKLGVPVPFTPEVPELNARVAAEKLLERVVPDGAEVTGHDHVVIVRISAGVGKMRL